MTKTQTQQIVRKALDEGKIPPPFLQLGEKLDGGGVRPTGAHTLKFISDRKVMGVDFMTKQPREEMEYVFEEGGMKKRYNVPILNKNEELHYFLQRMNDCEYGEVIILEMKKDGMKNFIDFKRSGGEVDNSTDNIPVVNEAGQEPQKMVPTSKGDVPYDPEIHGV